MSERQGVRAGLRMLSAFLTGPAPEPGGDAGAWCAFGVDGFAYRQVGAWKPGPGPHAWMPLAMDELRAAEDAHLSRYAPGQATTALQTAQAITRGEVGTSTDVDDLVAAVGGVLRLPGVDRGAAMWAVALASTNEPVAVRVRDMLTGPANAPEYAAAGVNIARVEHHVPVPTAWDGLLTGMRLDLGSRPITATIGRGAVPVYDASSSGSISPQEWTRRVDSVRVCIQELREAGVAGLQVDLANARATQSLAIGLLSTNTGASLADVITAAERHVQDCWRDHLHHAETPGWPHQLACDELAVTITADRAAIAPSPLGRALATAITHTDAARAGIAPTHQPNTDEVRQQIAETGRFRGVATTPLVIQPSSAPPITAPPAATLHTSTNLGLGGLS